MSDLNPLIEKHAQVEKFLKFLELDESLFSLPRVNGKFFYVTLMDGEPCISQFVNALSLNITKFCLQRKEKEKVSTLTIEDDMDAIQDLTVSQYEKARKLFIEASRTRLNAIAKKEANGEDISQYNKDGELGELILYIILERYFSAPQIVSKMPLKTNTAMPIHGCDGIHASIDSESKCLNLFWGESKLYQCPSSGIKSAINSSKNFITDSEHKERDIQIICDYPDFGSKDDKLKELLLTYFDPYNDNYTNKKEYCACFIGFESDDFKTMENSDADDLDTVFIDLYKEKIKSLVDKIENNIIDSKLKKLNFIFILTPFPSIKDLRDEFRKKIGY